MYPLTFLEKIAFIVILLLKIFSSLWRMQLDDCKRLLIEYGASLYHTKRRIILWK